jgi:hypothetical protein
MARALAADAAELAHTLTPVVNAVMAQKVVKDSGRLAVVAFAELDNLAALTAPAVHDRCELPRGQSDQTSEERGVTPCLTYSSGASGRRSKRTDAHPHTISVAGPCPSINLVVKLDIQLVVCQPPKRGVSDHCDHLRHSTIVRTHLNHAVWQ